MRIGRRNSRRGEKLRQGSIVYLAIYNIGHFAAAVLWSQRPATQRRKETPR